MIFPAGVFASAHIAARRIREGLQTEHSSYVPKPNPEWDAKYARLCRIREIRERRIAWKLFTLGALITLLVAVICCFCAWWWIVLPSRMEGYKYPLTYRIEINCP